MPQTAKEVTDLVYKEFWSKQNDKRVDAQEKQYNYYIGKEDAIRKYLNNALSLTYHPNDISEMQFNFRNFTKKLVRQLAVVYKEPPERKLVNDKGKVDEKMTEYYLSILPDDLNTQDKTAHRFAKLNDTSLTQVYPKTDGKKGKIGYRAWASYQLDVLTNDEDLKQIEGVSYKKYYNDELYTVVYTNDKHFKVDEFGKVVQIGDNAEMNNPYKVVPFAKFILHEQDMIWGEGMTDVINVNEQVNLLLTKLISRDIILGTEGTLLAVNLNLRKKGGKDKKGDGRTVVRGGLKHPISVDDVRADDATPSLTHVSFDPQIEEIRSSIDWYIKGIALDNGLNPNSFLADVQATSGYSKIIDSLEQLEIRQDDIEPARIFEKERFNITRKINNVMAGTKEGKALGYKIIPEDLELDVDFAEIEVQKTSQEIREDREFEQMKGMSTPVDWLREDNPDLSKDEAEAIIRDNKTFNNEVLKTTNNPFQSLIDKRNINKKEEE